jgi:ketosteroid isomerase-like protein
VDAAQRFVDAVNRGDAAALGEALAADAVLRSPITRSARFEGRERIVALYRDTLFPAIEDIAVAQIAADSDVRVLLGTGRAGGRSLEETTVIRLDAEGQIAEITLYVRDMAALACLAARLAGVA